MPPHEVPIETAAAEMVGRQVVGVRYYEICCYEGVDSPWERPHLHSVDFGLDLVTDAGCFGVTWSNDFIVYNLAIRRRPLVEAGMWRACFHRVDDVPPWDAILGSRIRSARLHWLDVTIDSKTTWYPQALVVDFEYAGSVTIAAGVWNADDAPLFAMGDEIAVIWDDSAVAGYLPHLADGPVARPA